MVQALERVVEDLIKRLVLDIVANLTAAPSAGGTPVDTGWARANWIPHLGEPVTEPAGSRDDVSTTEQDQGLAQVLGYRLTDGPAYVTNAVPYILELNEGSSRQAPPGFVQIAIAKAVQVDLAQGFGV